MNGAQSLLSTPPQTASTSASPTRHIGDAFRRRPGQRARDARRARAVRGRRDRCGRRVRPIADKPAAVLLHLGPGLGKRAGYLYNARRAHTPMIVVVGDHATYHEVRRPTGIRYRRPGRRGVGLGAPQCHDRRGGSRHCRRDRRQPGRCRLDPDPARGRVVVRRGGGRPSQPCRHPSGGGRRRRAARRRRHCGPASRPCC